MDRVTIWLAADGWRWRRRAANNRIISESGEAYARARDAMRAARRANPDLPAHAFRRR
jgi:uncharacterized protein YegP (UPF0339 family)